MKKQSIFVLAKTSTWVWKKEGKYGSWHEEEGEEENVEESIKQSCKNK